MGTHAWIFPNSTKLPSNVDKKTMYKNGTNGAAPCYAKWIISNKCILFYPFSATA